MNYINVFETDAAYIAAKPNLATPLLSFIDENDKVYCLSEVTGPTVEMVDLGLPSGTLWAKYNVGATCGTTVDSWYGNYYAWGETESGKDTYTWSNYSLCNGSETTLTKYNTLSAKGTVDNKTVLESTDDIAKVELSLRMPTPDECQELLDNTTKAYATNYNGITGLNGYTFTSNSNNSTLFIPAAGYYLSGSWRNVGSGGAIWSNTTDAVNNRPLAVTVISFGSSSISTNIYGRCGGVSVRGVQ